jgi:hypothetical protein
MQQEWEKSAAGGSRPEQDFGPDLNDPWPVHLHREEGICPMPA